jgi:hypothetical protein
VPGSASFERRFGSKAGKIDSRTVETGSEIPKVQGE